MLCNIDLQRTAERSFPSWKGPSGVGCKPNFVAPVESITRLDTAGAEETLTSVASILEKMVQSGVPHLVPARCNGKSESRKTSITRSPLNRPSPKLQLKIQRLSVPRLGSAVGFTLQGSAPTSPQCGAVTHRCRGRISLKSWATLLLSECLVPFPGFPTWCEERSPRQKVVEFDDLAELGLSRNCQKIPRRKCA